MHRRLVQYQPPVHRGDCRRPVSCSGVSSSCVWRLEGEKILRIAAPLRIQSSLVFRLRNPPEQKVHEIAATAASAAQKPLQLKFEEFEKNNAPRSNWDQLEGLLRWSLGGPSARDLVRRDLYASGILTGTRTTIGPCSRRCPPAGLLVRRCLLASGPPAGSRRCF